MRKLIPVILLCFIVGLSGCNKTEDKKVPVTNNTSVERNSNDEIEIQNENESANTEEKKQNSITHENASSICNKVIVVDAGHGLNSFNKQEAIAPNTSETKVAFAGGTSGANQTEEELNLIVALKLQQALESKGAIVYMTRTEHASDMTNIDRAKFANEKNAELSVKIHADGSENSSAHGVSVLTPGNQYIKDAVVLQESRKAADFILEEYVKSTGASNRGISIRNDLTGFNWSEVPIVLVEMGFMTNPEEDRLMETEEYQDKIVSGIVSGVERYFSAKDK